MLCTVAPEEDNYLVVLAQIYFFFELLVQTARALCACVANFAEFWHCCRFDPTGCFLLLPHACCRIFGPLAAALLPGIRFDPTGCLLEKELPATRPVLPWAGCYGSARAASDRSNAGTLELRSAGTCAPRMNLDAGTERRRDRLLITQFCMRSLPACFGARSLPTCCWYRRVCFGRLVALAGSLLPLRL